MERHRIPDRSGHRCYLRDAGRTGSEENWNHAVLQRRADRRVRPACSFGNMAQSGRTAEYIHRADSAAMCLQLELLIEELKELR
jgi:hypothetical protein